jgi:hypothetical protein
MIEQQVKNTMRKLRGALTGVVVIVASLAAIVSGSVFAAEAVLPTDWQFTLPAGDPVLG